MEETKEGIVEPKNKETIEFCLNWIKKISGQMDSLNGNWADALKFYRNDPEIVPVIEGRSKVVTTDLFDLVEWVKPSLLEIFAGSNDFVSLEPEGEEDVEAVKRQEVLVNKQIRSKNNWFLIMHDWLDDALKLKFGGAKYQWFTDRQVIDRRYEGLTKIELNAKMAEEGVSLTKLETVVVQEAEMDPLTGQETKPAVVGYNADLTYTVEDEYPLIEATPADEIGFPLTCREIDRWCPFFYHKVKKQKYQIVKDYSEEFYARIEARKDLLKDGTDKAVTQRFADLGGIDFVYDGENQEYTLYECYYLDPGTAAPMLAVLCGDELYKDPEKNKYGKPPFRIITPIKMAHRVVGMSFFDLIKNLQQLRTNIVRQVSDALQKSNFRRYFLNPDKVNLDDYLNNNVTTGMVRVSGDPSEAVMPEAKAPLPPELFSFLEMLNVEKDYHTGLPRSFQGVNPKILNKTFRGQAQQVNQASQRVQMLARLIAEMGVAPLVRDVVELNVRFLKKKTMIRYLNKWVEIAPDNIVSRCDVTVNVGVGTGNREMITSQLQQLLGIFAQVKKAGLSIVTEENVFHTLKELIKAMGFKDTSNFVTEPKQTALIKALVGLNIEFIKRTGGVDPRHAQLVKALAESLGMLKGGPVQGAGPAGRGYPGFPGESPTAPGAPGIPANPGLAPAGRGNGLFTSMEGI